MFYWCFFNRKLMFVDIFLSATSRQLVVPVQRALTAVQVRRLYGAGTNMETPSATHADSTSNCTAYVTYDIIVLFALILLLAFFPFIYSRWLAAAVLLRRIEMFNCTVR